MDHVAFVPFIAIFSGGLATVTIGMFWIANRPDTLTA
jgi:hypothetical protein